MHVTFLEHMTRCAYCYLKDTLAQANGNVSEAARRAHMHRGTFYKLCNRVGVSISGRESKLRHIDDRRVIAWLRAKPTTQQR
jgi:DNA-binding NtrC family response regulator